MTEPIKETPMQRIVKTIGRFLGRDDEAAAKASEERAKVAVEKLSKGPREKVRALVGAAVLVFALPGCNALAGLLRTDTGAAAPVNQATGGGGIAAMPGSTVVIMYGPQDARGDVGASGSSSAKGTATQSTAVDPAAIADAAGKLLATVPATSPAAALARASREVAATDPARGQALLDAAKVAPKEPAAPAEKDPAPAPAAPTAPEPVKTPDAPAGPAGGTAAPAVEPVK